MSRHGDYQRQRNAPLVDKVDDPRQVQRGARLEARRRQREQDDLRMVLSTESGRRFMWRLISYCGVFESRWDGSSRIHMTEGQRVVGLHLMDEILEADSSLMVMMQTEAIRRAENESLENLSSRTPSVDEQQELEP